MNRRSAGHRGGARLALVALTAILGACAGGADPELTADEQSIAAARAKLALDERAGNAAATADDAHAFFLAQQKLLQDRGEMTQDEKRIEGSHGDHGGGHM